MLSGRILREDILYYGRIVVFVRNVEWKDICIVW
jgi:hypothetical protein